MEGRDTNVTSALNCTCPYGMGVASTDHLKLFSD